MHQLYVLGHPVAHSKSPAMHNALYEELGLDWRYDLMDCTSLEQAQSFIDAGDFLGINITMPYKPLAFESAEIAYSSAVLAQGANVLVHAKEGFACHNMDGLGCVRYLISEGAQFKGRRIVVCGTGPTSLAIMHAAATVGGADVCLLGRDADKAKAVLDNYLERLSQTDDASLAKKCYFNSGDYESRALAIACADVVIDATPLGMKANDPAPFRVDLLGENQFVFDVVYGHGETALAKAAKQNGCKKFVDGSGMLVSQAVLGAWEFLKAGGVDSLPAYDKAFSIMAKAAGFSLQLS